MARKRVTGDGDPYTDAEEAELEAWLDRAFAADDAGGGDRPGMEPHGIDVTAVIEWAGTVDATTRLGPEGMRRTRLDGLDLTGVRAASERARTAAQADYGRAYSAKGWHAQLSKLTASPRGNAAADRAGLSPSRTTLRRWLSESQTPSRRNREAIERAYGDLRSQAASGQRSRAVAGARRQVAETLTGAVRQRYGVTVRFRDIRNLRLE
jgi:hypothetical protein